MTYYEFIRRLLKIDAENNKYPIPSIIITILTNDKTGGKQNEKNDL